MLAGKTNAGNRKTILRPYYEKKFYQIGRVHFYETIDHQNKNKTQRKNVFRCKSSKITNAKKEPHFQVAKYPVC